MISGPNIILGGGFYDYFSQSGRPVNSRHGGCVLDFRNQAGNDSVANDEAAGDSFKAATMKLAKPAGVKLIIKTCDDSIKALTIR